ncbi:MAG TPA: hypothetical protein VMV29_00835 [Ktedonobacterales bacterium]|nr:hypothetical protein [Ktedonobacterales bacterium]
MSSVQQQRRFAQPSAEWSAVSRLSEWMAPMRRAGATLLMVGVLTVVGLSPLAAPVAASSALSAGRIVQTELALAPVSAHAGSFDPCSGLLAPC